MSQDAPVLADTAGAIAQDAPSVMADTIGAIAQDVPAEGLADTTGALPHEMVKDLHELFAAGHTHHYILYYHTFLSYASQAFVSSTPSGTSLAGPQHAAGRAPDANGVKRALEAADNNFQSSPKRFRDSS